VHVGIQRGEGAVARSGDAVIVSAAGPNQESFCAGLLEALNGPDGAAPSPEAVVWQLAGLLTAYRASAPAFAAVVRVAGGIIVLLHGSAQAVVTAAGGELVLRGESALTWTEQFVAEPITSISSTVAAAGPAVAEPRSELIAGLVPGSGFVLTPGPVASTPQRVESPAAAKPLPEPQAAEPVLETAEPVLEAPVAVQEAAEAPPPMPPEPSPEPDANPSQTFSLPPPPVGTTDPQAGRKAHETMVVPASSAALVADNGARTPLDRDYVFGREPWNDQAVIDGRASPIVVRDPDNLVSRVQVHVMVRPSDGIVVIRDVSANGTYVAPPGGPEWMRLTQEPVSLPPGWSILMGSRVFTYTAPS
jgi:hypothetical protein